MNNLLILNIEKYEKNSDKVAFIDHRFFTEIYKVYYIHLDNEFSFKHNVTFTTVYENLSKLLIVERHASLEINRPYINTIREERIIEGINNNHYISFSKIKEYILKDITNEK